MEKTDAQLARDAGQGDTAAFGELVERYRASLVGYVAGLLGTRQDSEELAQETFLRAWQQAPLLRDPATVGAWLRRIAHNLTISHVRRPRVLRLAVDPPERAEAAADEDRYAAVVAAVGRLSEPHQDVIAKKHFAGHTLQQIADQLGIPAGTVRSRLARAYSELREILAEQEHERVRRTGPRD